jgi:hypothetical protein
MERPSTKKARALIRASYDAIISKINSSEGAISVTKNVTVNAGKALRKSDIYAIIAQDTGLCYSEATIEKYIHEYNAARGKARNTGNTARKHPAQQPS